MVTQGRDRVKGLSYWDKGWPSFEYALAMLIKVSNQSGGKDWPQVRNLGEVGGKQIELARSAPSEPLAFFEGHAYGEKAFTHGFDRDAIVAPKCAQPAVEPLDGRDTGTHVQSRTTSHALTRARYRRRADSARRRLKCLQG
jgi:hypothetical protein